MELEELRKKILKFNEAYEKGDPIVEDYIYDFYKKKLEIMENFENKKISNIIGHNFDKINTEPHLYPILSLNHDFGLNGIESFLKRICKYCNPWPLIAELKIDGVSIVIRYEKGVLKTIKTRGNGIYGENITYLKNFLNIPNKINYNELLEIRCEAYIEKNVLKNPRNAVAGMLLKKKFDPNLKYIKLAPHNLYSKYNLFSSYTELRNIFNSLCLECIEPFKICYNINDCYEFFNYVKDNRNLLNFEIDGIVLKINDKNIQDKLGNTAKSPRHAFAVKFSNAFNVATIKNIDFQMSRTGTITPVAYIDPTLINEKIITKATLNNINFLQEKNYNIGDIVQIEMAGDVIPKITKIIEKKTNKNIKIDYCPYCNGQLDKDKCIKNWECREQKIQKLIYFAGKNAMNIKNMGEKQIRFFVEENILNFPQDFFQIKNRLNNIKQNPKWLAQKSLSNILSNIEIARYTTKNRFFISIGLPLIGNEKVKLLSEKFTVQDFLDSTKESLNFLGDNIAQYVYEYKENEKYWILETFYCLNFNQKYKSLDLFSF